MTEHVTTAVFVYFVVLNAIYTALLALGSLQVRDWVKRRPMRDFDGIATSPVSTPVSILVPGYNEARVVAESVDALLATRYRNFEVLVINDGSTDDTLDVLRRRFDLVRVHRVPRVSLATRPVRAVYVSRSEPRLTVIDKDNGGKADALNCGIRYASYPLFCSIDCDTLLDPRALPRLVWAFQADPRTVASGGIVRIVNGSQMSDGRLSRVRTPRNMLVNVQIIEYLRAFLCSRAGWSRLGTLLVISGAFGLFRRETVVDAGGYDTRTVGEDAELVVRLHRYCRRRRMDYRVSFLADPICWTEAPASIGTLSRQRDRWQRGLLELLWHHRRMIANPRFGRVGMIGLPYLLLFEVVGPLIELSGFAWVVSGLVGGWVPPGFAALFAALAIGYGLVLSIGALLIEQRAFQRYPDWRDLRVLVVASVLENILYRQWMALVRSAALVTVFTRRRRWGVMTRRGLEAAAPSTGRLPAPALAPAASTGQQPAAPPEVLTSSR